MSHLPLDVLINILTFLPATRARHHENSSVKTLISCLRVGSLLRESALVSSIWQLHYQAQYLHCDERNDLERQSRLVGDWRLLYFERRRLDKVALDILEEMTLSRIDRMERARRLARMSMDVWDILELETRAHSAIPIYMDRKCVTEEAIPSYAPTRQFWAKSMVHAISRAYAVELWGKLFKSSPEFVSFEDAMTALSCFFGVSNHLIRRQLDSLAEECRKYLVANEATLDFQNQDYDLAGLCGLICRFMRDQGFGPPKEAHYRDMMNHFPHAYLTTNKKTIPISLVHVFVAICQRLGIDASPVNFPGTVLAHVPSKLPSVSPTLVAPSSDNPNDFILDLRRAGSNELPVTLQGLVDPCSAKLMLLRASRNILSAFRMASDLNHSVSQASMLAASCIHLLFTTENRLVTHMLMNLEFTPIDCATFLTDNLSPKLQHSSQELLSNHCEPVLESVRRASTLVKRRSEKYPVKFFVGMVFEHALHHYLGCIIGWDEQCDASEQWIEHMRVEELPQGKYQPFYNVISLDGTQRYVAEDNITARALECTQDMILDFFQEIDTLAIYFQGVELISTSNDNGKFRVRLCFSPESSQAYPEDESLAALWVNEGVIS